MKGRSYILVLSVWAGLQLEVYSGRHGTISKCHEMVLVAASHPECFWKKIV